MKLLYAFVATSLFAGQLLNAAAAVQPLSDEDVREIKYKISEHLATTEKVLDSIDRAKKQIIKLVEKNPSLAKKRIPQGYLEETLIEATYSPARKLFLANIKNAQEKYHKSMSEILKLQARLDREGLINDPRLSSLWQQLHHYHELFRNLVDRLEMFHQ